MSERNSNGFIWIMAAGVIFAIWHFDYNPFESEANVYLQYRYCEDEKYIMKCEWRNHTRQRHKINFEQQSVVTLNSDGSIIKVNNCSVFNENNWHCGYGENKFGFTEGEFIFGEMENITLRQTTKTGWWLVKLFGAEKIDSTW